MNNEEVLDIINAYDHITGNYRVRDQSLNASIGLGYNENTGGFTPQNASEGRAVLETNIAGVWVPITGMNVTSSAT